MGENEILDRCKLLESLLREAQTYTTCCLDDLWERITEALEDIEEKVNEHRI